jgi:hypothetical protein
MGFGDSAHKSWYLHMSASPLVDIRISQPVFNEQVWICSVLIILRLRTKYLIRALLSLADIAAFSVPQQHKFLSIEVGEILGGRITIGRSARPSIK